MYHPFDLSWNLTLYKSSLAGIINTANREEFGIFSSLFYLNFFNKWKKVKEVVQSGHASKEMSFFSVSYKPLLRYVSTSRGNISLCNLDLSGLSSLSAVILFYMFLIRALAA